MNPGLPSISVVVPSFDGGLKTLDKCLSIVRGQNYPQGNIEIILGHGGSEAKIKPIADKYKAKYVLIPENKQNAEYNRGVAFNLASKDLVLILDHDNFMPTKNFLRECVKPLLENKDIIAVESSYYTYNSSFSLLDRYFSLFGALDPVPYYLGKADRMRQDSHSWNLLGKATEKSDYYIVEFKKDPRLIPTVGTNGCLMRRSLVLKNADIRIGHHYPIDVMVDMVLKGHNKFAFTKNSITHMTGSRGFLSFLKRRYMFMTQYHFVETTNRRYSVFMKGDEFGIIKFIIISLTFVIPFYDSLRGYIKIHDPAWFLHPFMCFGITLMYGYATVSNYIKNIYENFNS